MVVQFFNHIADHKVMVLCRAFVGAVIAGQYMNEVAYCNIV